MTLLLALVFGTTEVIAQASPQLPTARTDKSPNKKTQIDILAQFDALTSKLYAGDGNGALAEARSILARPDFATMDAALQFRCYLMAGILERELGSPEVAMQHLTTAGEAEPQFRDGTYWQAYTQVSADVEDYTGAANAMAEIAVEYPDLLDTWNERFITRILREAGKSADRSVKKHVLQALLNSGYRPKSGYLSLENYWLDLVDIHLEDGEDSEAAAVAATLTQPTSIAALGFDGRLAVFAPSDLEAAFREAVDKRVEDGRALLATYPRDARAVALLANTLADVDSLPEALALLDEAIARVDAAIGRPAFDDEEKYLEWIHNARTRILMRLGRWDEAIESQIRSRDISHSYDPGAVSQSINLGDLYYLLGEPAKALEAVGDMDLEKANEFGVSAAKEVEACAFHQQGETAKAAEALNLLVEHVADNFLSAKLGLLCIGDSDRLARLIVARLQDPATRRDMLRDLQIYSPLPTNTEMGRQMDALYDEVRNRPEVREAVAATGKILSWPIFRPGT